MPDVCGKLGRGGVMFDLQRRVEHPVAGELLLLRLLGLFGVPVGHDGRQRSNVTPAAIPVPHSQLHGDLGGDAVSHRHICKRC